MALETGTYISDLVAANPTSGDAKSQGDDHLRLLKSTIKVTFPNVSGAVTPTHTELNFVAGVTSPIQTQLAGKTDKGPAFSAYQNAGHSFAHATLTKVQLQLEEFDTAAVFDSTTNYRFTPNVAGYYQLGGGIEFPTSCQMIASVYKNGVELKRGSNATGNGARVSALVFMNGSTDYVELFAFQAAGVAQTSVNGAGLTYFQGCLVRSS